MKTARAIVFSAALATSTRHGGRGGVSAFVRSSAGITGRRMGARNTFAGRSLSPLTAVSAAGFAVASTGGYSVATVPAFSHAGNAVRMMFSNPFKKPEVNYEELDGAAEEAARAALKGEVPSKTEAGDDIATFAGGCFWGLELAFQRVPGVVGTSVGYTQGQQEKPAYGEVCSGRTGHTEAVQVYYKSSQISFEELCKVFFGRIDPTQKDGQGGDWGTQYRTGVYFHAEEQEEVARAVMQREQGKYTRPIVTECQKAQVYWPAELYHQQYLAKGGRFGQPQSAEKGATDTIRCYG